MRLFWKIIVCVVAVEAFGALNSFWTRDAMQRWYPQLTQPPGTPPDVVFAPVWIVLYAMMGVAAGIVWHKSITERRRDRAMGWFITQFVLNLAWTPLFFGAKQMFLALLVLIFMWIAIFMTIRTFSPVSKLAAWLLIPYLIWVTYAGYLNLGFLILN